MTLGPVRSHTRPYAIYTWTRRLLSLRMKLSGALVNKLLLLQPLYFISPFSSLFVIATIKGRVKSIACALVGQSPSRFRKTAMSAHQPSRYHDGSRDGSRSSRDGSRRHDDDVYQDSLTSDKSSSKGVQIDDTVRDDDDKEAGINPGDKIDIDSASAAGSRTANFDLSAVLNIFRQCCNNVPPSLPIPPIKISPNHYRQLLRELKLRPALDAYVQDKLRSVLPLLPLARSSLPPSTSHPYR